MMVDRLVTSGTAYAATVDGRATHANVWQLLFPKHTRPRSPSVTDSDSVQAEQMHHSPTSAPAKYVLCAT